jgi:hypothetical protein
MTSGHVAVYDRSGTLQFEGGITAGRGHEGPSDGADAALAALTGRRPLISTAPVYGCPLIGADQTTSCPACAAGDQNGAAP